LKDITVIQMLMRDLHGYVVVRLIKVHIIYAYYCNENQLMLHVFRKKNPQKRCVC